MTGGGRRRRADSLTGRDAAAADIGGVKAV